MSDTMALRKDLEEVIWQAVGEDDVDIDIIFDWFLSKLTEAKAAERNRIYEVIRKIPGFAEDFIKYLEGELK